MNEKKIKKDNLIFFLFILFLVPLLLHIYGAIFDLLTQGYFYVIVIILIAFIPLLGIRSAYFENEEKSLLIFLLMLVVDTLFFNQANFKDTIKYMSYILLYIYFLKSYIDKLIFYKYFVRFISIIIVVEIFLYILLPFFPDIISAFSKEKLNFLNSTSSFLTRTDWNYSLPFYLISYPVNTPENGLSGLPRFFGFSTEPTMFSCVILPLLFIACSLKEKSSFYILLIAFFLSSSYGAFAILILSLIYYSFFKYRNFITFFLIIFFLYILYELHKNQIPLHSPRLKLYSKILLNTLDIEKYIALFSKGFNQSMQVPTAMIHFLLQFGLVPMLAYLMILINILKYTKNTDKFIFSFSIAFILMLNKSGEILSPLFLFFLNYIYVYKKKIKYFNKNNFKDVACAE